MNIKSKSIMKSLSMPVLIVAVAGFVTMLPATGSYASAQPANNPAKCTAGADSCVPEATDPAFSGCNNDSCNVVKEFVNPFIRFLTAVVGVAVVVGIAYGGIQYAASGGDPQKAAAAKLHIRNSIIALVAFFFLYYFLRFLTPTL